MHMYTKKILTFFLFGLASFCLVTIAQFSYVHAAEASDFFVIPEGDASTSRHVTDLSNAGGSVWEEYRDKSINAPDLAGSENLGNQLRTGIMTRDTFIYFLIYALQFLTQFGILVGVAMFIFNGYKYASYAITGQEASPSAINHAIAGILVIVFSYAILNLLRNAFL